MTEKYKNAFAEVYEIINYLDDYNYNKIPKDVINVIEENRNKKYIFFLDESIPFTEQKIMPETKAILFNFFRDYFATQKQREKIKKFQRIERAKREQLKKKNCCYKEDIFEKKSNIKIKDINKESEEFGLIKVDENNLFIKLFNFVKRLFNKNKDIEK